MSSFKDPDTAWRDHYGEIYPAFSRGVEKDVFIKGTDGELEYGKVWPYMPGVYLDDIVQESVADIYNLYLSIDKVMTH